jgi:hypothetical protein
MIKYTSRRHLIEDHPKGNREPRRGLTSTDDVFGTHNLRTSA